MTLRDWIVPDEMQSALSSAHRLAAVAQKTSHFWLKHLFASGIPFAIGAAVGIAVCGEVPTVPKMSGLKDVVGGILTFITVLAGFVVTLMLFTGRTEGSRTLSVDQAPLYIEKVTYLLFSQALTLCMHFGTIVACVGWLVAQGINAPPGASRAAIIVSFGFLTVSLVRSILLPFQIYDVHHFELQAMLAEKVAEYDAILRAEEEKARSD